MSRKPQSLQMLAYRAVTDEMRDKIKADPGSIKEQSVLADLHSISMEMHKQIMRDWVPSARIPKEVQTYLILMNSWVNDDFYAELKKTKNDGEYLHDMDFFEYFTVFINKQAEFTKYYNERTRYTLHKWHLLVMNTFRLLCYKRLNHIFNLDSTDFSNCITEEFLEEISALEESRIIPLTIYKMLDRKFTKDDLKD